MRIEERVLAKRTRTNNLPMPAASRDPYECWAERGAALIAAGPFHASREAIIAALLNPSDPGPHLSRDTRLPLHPAACKRR